jgi:nitrite reductase (NO-forming)
MSDGVAPALQRPANRPSGRAAWHRRVGVLPLGYLAAIVAVGFVHPFIPGWRWLLIHLLLLGAATNAIVIWSTHFANAVLRVPPPQNRHGQTLRLTALNLGVVAVLGVAWQPLAVAGAGLVFAAVLAHLLVLAGRLRRALSPPLAVTVHYYLVAGAALLVGIPAGAWMMVVDDRAPVLLFHAHVNVLGWITLTVLGTLLTLWPTVLRTRMPSDAVRWVTRALPLAGAGLVLLGVGLIAWWPAVVAGVVVFAGAVAVSIVPAVAAARRSPPSSFAAWSIVAGIGWLFVALGVDTIVLIRAEDPASAVAGFGAVLVPLLAGFVAQVLIGSLAYLLPMVLGGGPARVRARQEVMDRHWAQRVVMGNTALAVFLLPVGGYVRITTSLLVLAALVQFLVAAVRAVMVDRRS